MVDFSPRPRVFVSHSSLDMWVARQIAEHIGSRGAATFLDCHDLQDGDFEDTIRAAISDCDELALLITPWSLKRRFVWMEVGGFWSNSKRIDIILYGVTQKQLTRDDNFPTYLKRLTMVDLNSVDAYFDRLGKRVENWRKDNGYA